MYHLELNFEEYYVVDDEGTVHFIGEFEEAIDNLNRLRADGEKYEECEHGLSLWLCEGPNHYPEGV